MLSQVGNSDNVQPLSQRYGGGYIAPYQVLDENSQPSKQNKNNDFYSSYKIQIGNVTYNSKGEVVKENDKNKKTNILSKTTSKSKFELNDSQKKQIEDLKKIDREVRSHEQAHISAGGALVRGGARFNYTTGPDGVQYAIGGEVQIDISPVQNDPQATILKMQQVKSAALAPSDPSGQDRSVASRASQLESQARSELINNKSGQVTENIKKTTNISKKQKEITNDLIGINNNNAKLDKLEMEKKLGKYFSAFLNRDDLEESRKKINQLI